MKNLLRIIRDELNPRHDFDRVSDISTLRKMSVSEEFVGGLYFCANMFKHIIRGGGVGAGFGALSFYAAGENPKLGAVLGFTSGSCVDLVQYLLRGVIIPATKDIYTNIRDIFKKSSYNEISK